MEIKDDSEIQNLVMTKKRFQGMIEIAARDLSLNYLDSIVHLCDKHGIDVEDVKKYISPVIKDKLEADAMRLRYLKGGGNELPID
tara:strand:- start:1320 stop:1574 length:255 start_codon:yes stop_codon:yes gene_type:complete